jgi:SnoaL-like domain
MDDRIIELLYRNLQEVFGEGDAARRRAAIQDLYTEDCVLHVPPGVFVGHDALDEFAGDLRATHPHFVYTPHEEPQALHNAGIPPGAQAQKATPRTTPEWMSSLSAMARSLRSMSFSIPNLHRGAASTPCLQAAQSRHADGAAECPLLGVKRTSAGPSEMSANDPKRTSADIARFPALQDITSVHRLKRSRARCLRQKSVLLSQLSSLRPE